MGKMPYYGLNPVETPKMESVQQPQKSQLMQEGLNIINKFVEQRERAQTGKLLAKARSDLTIKLSDLEKEVGLDAEGFQNRFQEITQDYENNILSSVPFSQREDFQNDFAGLKYSLITKAGLYENVSLSEKMVNDVKETFNYNANTILGDYTQRQQITNDTITMIDGLDVADSVKDGLKKDMRETYALSEINALTTSNPNLLLKNLNSGLYDKDIKPNQKATAIMQAKNKIESDKRDAQIQANAMANEYYNNALLKIMSGEVRDLDFEQLVSNPILKNDPNKINSLMNFYDKFKESEYNYQQTEIDLNRGVLYNSTDKATLGRMDSSFDKLIKANPEVSAVNENADFYTSKSNYVPRGYSAMIMNMSNSSSIENKKFAAESWYQMMTKYPYAKTNMDKARSEELFAYGAGLKAGYSAVELDNIFNSVPDAGTVKVREKNLNKAMKDGIDYDTDVESDIVTQEANKIYSAWYMRTGSDDIAKEAAEKFINTNYGNTTIGVGNKLVNGEPIAKATGIIDFFLPSAKTTVMYQPPEKIYAINGLSSDENIKWMNDDLISDVQSVYPDMKAENIRIFNDLIYGSDGRPKYLVTDEKGVPLYVNGDKMRWVPNYHAYMNKRKELEIERKQK